jgi:PRTRC genetic system protein B
MQVHLSIGENHRFELREALLVYKGNQSSFITHHEVNLHEQAPPTLGPAQPLTLSFVESLVRSMGGNSDAEVLPENVLAKGDRTLVWWSQARYEQMFYTNAEGKASALNGKTFAQPPLVWRVSHGRLKIRALTENKRPHAKTKLAFAPFWNISNSGEVCLGSMRCPDSAAASAIPAWERGFYESAFTHGNVARLTRHKGGFEAMWGELAGKRKPFPCSQLISMPETLAQFVRSSGR